MPRLLLGLIAALGILSSASAQQATSYFPERGDWQSRPPKQSGFDVARLDEAIKFAVANETSQPKDQALVQRQTFGKSEPAPHNAIVGPMKTRAPLSGVIVHRGYVVAEWGDTDSVDMTHSVTKTFLTTVVGLAVQKGLIKDVADKVRGYMPAGVDLFDAPQNQPITWDHLLRQTSDWQGTLFGKPDWADRPEGKPEEWANRKLHPPGTRYKYNDVRVNVLALAALHVLRKPLPEVLREEIMDPIGASTTWRWHGYENSWIELDGSKVQSVTGGGHYGGGMFIHAWDLARFGYLFLRNGKWKDRQLVAEKWIQMARTPGSANPEYGHANWFLNPGRKVLAAAPETSVTFRGAGQNIVYVDWDNDLVIVVRWIRSIPALNEFIGKVLAAKTG